MILSALRVKGIFAWPLQIILSIPAWALHILFKLRFLFGVLIVGVATLSTAIKMGYMETLTDWSYLFDKVFWSDPETKENVIAFLIVGVLWTLICTYVFEPLSRWILARVRFGTMVNASITSLKKELADDTWQLNDALSSGGITRSITDDFRCRYEKQTKDALGEWASRDPDF